MSFLAPLFLLGGLLIAGPIIAHLIRRSTRDRVRFSDTRLLEPSPPRLQRRSRIENWWLLVLRCLVVLVLATGFARPFLRREIPPPAPGRAPHHVVAVLDDSASMRREGLWEDATARVRAAVRELDAGDRFALLTAGGDITELIGGEQWARTPPPERPALVDAALQGREPGWGPSRLDAAIDAALDEIATLADATEEMAEARILLISDCTEGARVAGLAGRDWPPRCRVEIVRIDNPGTSDVSLQWLGWTTSPAGRRAARVRVVEHSGRPITVNLHLRALRDGAELGPVQSLPLAPGGARVTLVEVPVELREPLRLELAGDEEAFNNTLWLVPPQPRELTLPYFGAHDPDDSRHALFYLTRAVGGWRDPKVRLQTPGDPEPAAGDNAAPPPLVVVAEAQPDAVVRRLRTQVEAGTIALVLLADASMIPTAAALAGEENWAAAPPPPANALLGSIDFQHPLFAPFADPRYSDFTRVRFWKPVPVALPPSSGARVVARFDDGSPAVLEVEAGAGRVVVWGGDWSNVASQWVLSTKFVPWLQALVERATGGPPRPNVAEIGDSSALGLAGNVRWTRVEAAGPAENPTDAEAGDDAVDTAMPATPGVYRIEQEGQTRLVALQVPAVESRNNPMPDDTWEQLGVPIDTAPVTTAAAAEESERERMAASDAVTESRQQFWRWLLIAAAALLAVESIVAIRAAQKVASAAEAA